MQAVAPSAPVRILPMYDDLSNISPSEARLLQDVIMPWAISVHTNSLKVRYLAERSDDILQRVLMILSSAFVFKIKGVFTRESGRDHEIFFGYFYPENIFLHNVIQ